MNNNFELDINVPRVHSLAAGLRTDATAVTGPTLASDHSHPLLSHYIAALHDAVARVSGNASVLQERLATIALDGDTFAGNVSAGDAALGSTLERKGAHL